MVFFGVVDGKRNVLVAQLYTQADALIYHMEAVSTHACWKK
jgi:hypothetical protein